MDKVTPIRELTFEEEMRVRVDRLHRDVINYGLVEIVILFVVLTLVVIK
jgi:hypothetical protein